jgi:ABC-type phosphate transport system substrate-binding protein
MKMKSIILLLLGCLVGSAASQPAKTHAGDMAVVVNPKNDVDGLSLADVRRIFAGEKGSWSGGRPIKILVRGTGTLERNAMLRLLGVSETEFKQHWSAQIYRGEAKEEPILLPSNGMQKEALGVYADAIAMVDAKDIKAGMKVIKIDGHMPGEEGYPLR